MHPDEQTPQSQELALAQEAQAQLQHLQQTLAQAQERAVEFVKKNPGLCLVGGLALGYLLGRVARSRWLR